MSFEKVLVFGYLKITVKEIKFKENIINPIKEIILNYFGNIYSDNYIEKLSKWNIMAFNKSPLSIIINNRSNGIGYSFGDMQNI